MSESDTPLGVILADLGLTENDLDFGFYHLDAREAWNKLRELQRKQSNERWEAANSDEVNNADQ